MWCLEVKDYFNVLQAADIGVSRTIVHDHQNVAFLPLKSSIKFHEPRCVDVPIHPGFLAICVVYLEGFHVLETPGVFASSNHQQRELLTAIRICSHHDSNPLLTLLPTMAGIIFKRKCLIGQKAKE